MEKVSISKPVGTKIILLKVFFFRKSTVWRQYIGKFDISTEREKPEIYFMEQYMGHQTQHTVIPNSKTQCVHYLVY